MASLAEITSAGRAADPGQVGDDRAAGGAVSVEGSVWWAAVEALGLLAPPRLTRRCRGRRSMPDRPPMPDPVPAATVDIPPAQSGAGQS